MKCPECVKRGNKSKVYVGCSSTTLVGWIPYYDEDGKFVSNDPNTTTTSYSCSLGHRWSETA